MRAKTQPAATLKNAHCKTNAGISDLMDKKNARSMARLLLTSGDIDKITSRYQARLLVNARRNNRTNRNGAGA